MNKSSQSIVLVLIGSSALIAGCGRSTNAGSNVNNANNAVTSSYTDSTGTHYYHNSHVGGYLSNGSRASSGGTSSSSSTSRGGFGSIGHSFGGGGHSFGGGFSGGS